MAESGGLGKWIAGILAAVIASVAAFAINQQVVKPKPTPVPTQSSSDSAGSQTPGQALAGQWTLDWWSEADTSTTLGMNPTSGELTVVDDGRATWSLTIDDRYDVDTDQQQSSVACSGEIPISGAMEGRVTGTVNYTANMDSLQRDIAAAFCGGGVGVEAHPFTVTYQPASEANSMEMANDLGRFRWSR